MIFDIEADGLEKEATKIHVMAYTDGPDVLYTHDYEVMRELLSEADCLIGHNIVCYDVPVLERLLQIKIGARLIDTLPLSWYLNHKRIRHGLETYGEDYNIPKPKITDWENLTPKEYAHRCIEDVKINRRLWADLSDKLSKLYTENTDQDRLINYLTFKMECLRLQEKSGWKLDIPKAEKHAEELRKLKEEQVELLEKAMPPVQKWVSKTRPSKPYKADGSYSVLGAKWFKLLKDRGLSEDYQGEVLVEGAVEEPNPNSSGQVKAWLTSLGWVPCSFKYKKDANGNERAIPQVRVEGEGGKELAPSVMLLIEDNPEVGVLADLTTITHRLSVFEGFLENHVDGYLTASAAGLTNTLRFKHRVLVNLPGVDKPWGKEIRGCLIAPEGYELCGSDQVSLESTTKRHYMFPYDPEYVAEMSKPGFDEHLDLAKQNGQVTQEEINLFQKEGTPYVKAIRKKFKPVNYAGVYGVGKTTLSRSSGIPEKECGKLIKAYWKRNWAVKKVAEDTLVKTLDGEMWLFNPVSKFWYSLRYEKDTFSTLNQGTGVFCFDKWLQEVLKRRKQLTAQFHDEGCWCLKKGYRTEMEKILKESIRQVNLKLNLNVDLDVDVQFGDNYAEIH